MAITLTLGARQWRRIFSSCTPGSLSFQDKRFFSSAPKENLDAIPDKKERFRGAHVIGWIIGILAILMFAGAFVLAAWDGVRKTASDSTGSSRGFIAILLHHGALRHCVLRLGACSATRTFSRTSIREPKGVVESHQFGYNKKSHITHFIVYIPVCAALAGICMLF